MRADGLGLMWGDSWVQTEEVRLEGDTIRFHSEEEELRDVEEYLTGSFVFALERNSNLASYAIRAKRFDLGFDYLHRYPGLIRSVTVDDVQTVAQRHRDRLKERRSEMLRLSRAHPCRRGSRRCCDRHPVESRTVP